jgi:hypothetical protein
MNVAEIRSKLNEQLWEDCGNGEESRRVFLGTTIGLADPEDWLDEVEELLEPHGMVIESGEGSFCDVFVAEYRPQRSRSDSS